MRQRRTVDLFGIRARHLDRMRAAPGVERQGPAEMAVDEVCVHTPGRQNVSHALTPSVKAYEPFRVKLLDGDDLAVKCE